MSFFCIFLGASFYTDASVLVVSCPILGQTVSVTTPVTIPVNEKPLQLLETETSRMDDLRPRQLAEARLGKSGCENATIGNLEEVTRLYPKPGNRRYFRVNISNPNNVPIRYLLLQTSKPMQYLLTRGVRLFDAIELPKKNCHVYLYRVKPWNQGVALKKGQNMDIYFAFEEVTYPWSLEVYANECA